jgi:hypothetical protein
MKILVCIIEDEKTCHIRFLITNTNRNYIMYHKMKMQENATHEANIGKVSKLTTSMRSVGIVHKDR